MSQPREHKFLDYPGRGGDEDNPLNPHNGNLVATLDSQSKLGWELISFDWSSWCQALFARTIDEDGQAS